MNSYHCHPSPYTTKPPTHTHTQILKWAVRMKTEKVFELQYTFYLLHLLQKLVKYNRNFSYHLCLAISVCVCVCVDFYVLTYVCMYVCLSVRFPEGRLCSISCKLFLSSMKWYKDDMKIFDLPQYKRCSLISPTLKIFFLSQKDSSRSKFSQCMLLLKVVIYWKCV